jgi:hypothetical protein
MRKLLAPPAIHFKGTGWAKKERAAARPGRRSSDEGAPSEKAASGLDADSPATSSKPAPAASAGSSATNAASTRPAAGTSSSATEA